MLLLLAMLLQLQSADTELADPAILATFTTATALLGKTATSGAFNAVFALTSESYPTTLRAAALGCGMVFGKIGAGLAPPLLALLPAPVTMGALGVLLLGAAGASTTLDAPSAGDAPKEHTLAAPSTDRVIK